MAVEDNRISHPQITGHHTKTRNLRLTYEVRKLFRSPFLCKNTRKGYHTSLVFTLRIFTGLSPTYF